MEKPYLPPCFQGKYGLFLACENNLLINCKLVNPKIEFWHSPPLRDLRNLRENIHMRVLNLLAQMKRPILPQIPLIYADKTQNNKTALTSNNLSFSAK